MKIENLTMLTDFYEPTMANGYFEHGLKDEIAYFDMFLEKCLTMVALLLWQGFNR